MATSTTLLDHAYEHLDYRRGSLLDAADRPTRDLSEAEWLNKGEWLSLAHAAGAEKVFFVEDNPVIIFANAGNHNDIELRTLINRIWCMGRPQCLFLSTPGQLDVIDLTRPPIAPEEPMDARGRLVRRVRTAAEVQSELADYRREFIETGQLPKDQGFFSPGHARADQALISDLRTVRDALIGAGLNDSNPRGRTRFANALIGRSIFIRYLEDRGILLPDDFTEVAQRRHRWTSILEADDGVPLDPTMNHVRYTKILKNKEFTYAFFKKIFSDFNGDIFPIDDDEYHSVTQEHLDLLRKFLCGDITNTAPSLFFFAYNFRIIPIELISSIYESFYNSETGSNNNQGAHYTPIELVEFILNQTLTPNTLHTNPIVLDPACGSGIFLVEAFRRIVRYRQANNGGRRLRLDELRKILREQIKGIDINPEAIRVAAFSLDLALLHYLKPPDIWRDRRLPRLVHESTDPNEDGLRYGCLTAGNAFTVLDAVNGTEHNHSQYGTPADIIVGNPPWGYPKASDTVGTDALRVALEWCRRNNKSIGDMELSQAFIHLASSVLRTGGVAGLLVSSGIFFKKHAKSQKFRQQWLSSNVLVRVVNFAAVRDLFFSHAVAPFASVVFEKHTDTRKATSNNIEYWTAKRTLSAKRFNAAVLTVADRKILPQFDAIKDDRLWKVYWWGNHHDRALIAALESERTLESIAAAHRASSEVFGQGFKEANKRLEARWLREFKEYPISQFDSFGPLDTDALRDPPRKVERRGLRHVYEGNRLLIKRGISQSQGVNGQIIARLERTPFCFRNSIHGVNLDDLLLWQRETVLLITLSSLARYFFFMTSGSWGMWHHELVEADVKRLPVRFPTDSYTRTQISALSRKIRSRRTKEARYIMLNNEIDFEGIGLESAKIQQDIDEVVFSLFGLSQSEVDQITDLCETGLDLFYRHIDGKAVRPLMTDDLPQSGILNDVDQLGCDILARYLRTLISHWNCMLAGMAEIQWSVIPSRHPSAMLAVILELHGIKHSSDQSPLGDLSEWNDVLAKLDALSLQHYGSSKVYTDGMIRLVSDSAVLIVKRNERRLWTPSVAVEDAEATIKQAMLLQAATA